MAPKKKFTDHEMSKERKISKPKEALWKLQDGITFSGLSRWMDCREQFSLQWIDGLTPKKISIPLEFGSVIHYGLEHQFCGRSPKEIIRAITEQYRAHRSKTLLGTGERDTLDLILGLAETVFPHYCEFWHYDDRHINWIEREAKFKIPYSFPTHEGMREVLLRGMRDGIYSYGSVYGVFETKTKSRIIEKDIIDNLHADMQTMMYCFCTYLSTGRYPNEVKYNIIRRPDTYRRKGEALAPYLKRVEKDIIERPEFYFLRYTANISSADIQHFVNKTLNPVLALFVQWYDSVKKNPVGEARFQSQYHYLNSTALVGKYGRAEMWDAIFGNLQPYKVRQAVFPELEDSFQVTLEEDSKWLQLPETDPQEDKAPWEIVES
jgi:hypothetical protein